MNKQSHIHKKADSSASNPVRSQLQSHPFIAQAQLQSEKPLSHTETENQEFQQQKFEATKLELQAKHDTITPEGQERLTVLQAKMSGSLQRRLQHASSNGSNFANIPISRADAPLQEARPDTPTSVQEKLTIGQPGDQFELEADVMARKVMSMSAVEQPELGTPEQTHLQVRSKPLAAEITPFVQHKAMPQSDRGLQGAGDFESRLRRSKGGGSPLPKGVQAFMEPRYGADVSDVRVHTGSEAMQMNQGIGALAFTHGKHIYYGAGQSPRNDELTAHELAHTFQQSGSAVQRSPQLLEKVRQHPTAKPASPLAANGAIQEKGEIKSKMMLEKDLPTFKTSPYGDLGQGNVIQKSPAKNENKEHNPQSSGQNQQNQEAQKEVQKEQEDPQMYETVIQFEKRLEDNSKEYEKLHSELEELEKRVLSTDTDTDGDNTLLDVLMYTSQIQKIFIDYKKKINTKKALYKKCRDKLDENLKSIKQLKFNNEELKKEANLIARLDFEKFRKLLDQIKENQKEINSKETIIKNDSQELDKLLDQEKKHSGINIPNIEEYVSTVNKELNDKQKEPWSSDQSPDSNSQSDLDEVEELSNSDSDEDISFNEQEPSVSTTTPALENNLLPSEVPAKQSENKKDSEFGKQEEEFRMVPPRRKPRDYSGKNSENTIPVVSLDDKRKATFVKELNIGNTTFARQKSRSIQIVKVLLPKNLKREEKTALFEEPFFTFQATKYRFDLFASKDPNVAWAIEADEAGFSDEIHPFDEAVIYTRQAFLTQPLTGLQGSINGASVKVNTPFVLSNTQPPIQLLVGDGWGFIKASQVKKSIEKINQKPSKPRLEQPAQPNTQMLQWLPEDQGLIFELVESGKKQLEKTSSKKQSQPLNQEQSEENVKRDEALYRGVSTGSFPVKVGTAMPVPGEEVVLSGGFLPNGTNVALHRSPADKLNWNTGRVADAQSALSKFMATMTALQYRWSGYQSIQSDRSFVFFKGMLGVIPDKNWPSKYSDVNIVVCSEDRKVDSSWEKSEDVERAKESEGKFNMQGNLAISKIITPGGTIGVPPSMMKKLSGDYDGDEVHLLAEQDSPVLFNLITSQKDQENDKLKKDRQFPDKKPVPEKQSEHDKVLASNPFAVLDEDTKEVSAVVEGARSLGTRLQEIQIGDNLVGIWSTIADLLKTVDPVRLRGGYDQDSETGLAYEIGLQIIERGLTEAELWQYVGRGIKAGTDLAKTNLKNATFAGRTLTPQELLKEGKELLKFLSKKGLKSPHKRRNKQTIAKDIREGKRISVLNVRKGHYGNLSGIMHGLDLHLEMTRTSKDFAPNGELAEKQGKVAEEYLKKASSQPITNVKEATPKIYELLGKLKQVVSRDRNNENAKENGDIWMLFALNELKPAEWRNRLYKKFSDKSENNPSDLKQEYDTMVEKIKKLWQRWIKMKPKNV
ncbi:MAG: DUF4157 domain-containing protein [Nostoc sp.]|uniref:eCIS core domain-containing protein n=1 Tax=Nostoc sp. TaxID=1180 RepID=UPI002FF7A3FB